MKTLLQLVDRVFIVHLAQHVVGGAAPKEFGSGGPSDRGRGDQPSDEGLVLSRQQLIAERNGVPERKGSREVYKYAGDGQLIAEIFYLIWEGTPDNYWSRTEYDWKAGLLVSERNFNNEGRLIKAINYSHDSKGLPVLYSELNKVTGEIRLFSITYTYW